MQEYAEISFFNYMQEYAEISFVYFKMKSSQMNNVKCFKKYNK